MRVFNVVRSSVGVVAMLAASVAAAATIVVSFPEFNGAPFDSGFPLPPVAVGTQTFSIPAGDRIVSAAISGFWGTTTKPDSTAGVTVFLDDVEVARCEKPDPGCWLPGDSGQRAWRYTYTAPQLVSLNDGAATLTAVQTSDAFIRLGVSTLVHRNGADLHRADALAPRPARAPCGHGRCRNVCGKALPARLGRAAAACERAVVRSRSVCVAAVADAAIALRSVSPSSASSFSSASCAEPAAARGTWRRRSGTHSPPACAC